MNKPTTESINWTTPDQFNLERLKNIKNELENLIMSMEQQQCGQYDDEKHNINLELYSKSNYKHKTRSTKQINVNVDNFEQPK